MSLLKPKPLLPVYESPAIEVRLREAESRLAALQKEHESAALSSVSGAGNDALTQVQAEIAKTCRDIETLQAAHRAALKKDEAERRARLAAEQRTQIRAIILHTERRYND